MVLKKNPFTNDRSVIITILRHVFSEKIIITAVNNGARTVSVTKIAFGSTNSDHREKGFCPSEAIPA